MAEEQAQEAPKKEDWMQKQWRPMMAMMYMCVCAADFIVFPIMYTIVQFWETQAANDAFRQWQPLTLQGAGLFHMAMGAVLGITAFGRTQEKIAGAATTTAPTTPVSVATPIVAPTAAITTAATTTEVQPQVTTGFNGKLAPPPAPQPPL
jgi:hypothetical protein